ncbi:MAG: L,D-transpeptidase [Candidatus Beckwithbacteria bacterium]|nr:L,D-transpeptidase [Candidatus Beckwithbacteria bacterium]
MTGKLIGLFLLVLGLTIGGIFAFRPKEVKPNFSLKVENGVMGVFHGQEVMPPAIDLAAVEPETQVLGDADPNAEKHIYIDLSTQTLTAYQGDSLFMQVLVSTGKWGRTPTGEFTIWSKFRATRMSGGSGSDYYDLPNVPYVMFFSGSGVAAAKGFSMHGTYWHNNFGHPMSHGCVNMRTVDAQKLFNWAGINEKITIYGQAPG